jgi:hypothetical protein
MNIVGRYDDSDISLEGQGESLLELAQLIRRTTGPVIRSLMIPSTPPAPYDDYAKSLKLEPTDSYVRISRDETQIRISGSPDKLAILADNIEWIATHTHLAGDSGYIDIDYHPDHFYLEKGSIPLMVTKNL